MARRAAPRHCMSAKPLIAVVLKGYPRLSETFIAQEVLALEQAGFAIVIFSLRHPTDEYVHEINSRISATVTYLPEYLRDEPCRVVAAATRQLLRPAFWQTCAQFLQDYWRDHTINRVRRFGQAIVLADELPKATEWVYAHFIHTPGSVARYGAQIRRLPLSLSAHAKDIWTIPEWEVEEKLTAARWTVCCTKAYSNKLRKAAPGAIVHNLYHGIDTSRFTACQDYEKQVGFHIVCVARAVPKKGIDTLLQAVAVLPAEINWRLTHIGGGPEENKLAALAMELGIGMRVSWLGPRAQDEVLALLRQGDVFCLPARLASDGDRDGLPNVLMEALSQSLPVIVTDIGGITELVDEKCGIIVPPDAPGELAAAITNLANDPQLCANLGFNGRQRIERHFSFEQNVAQLIGYFRQSLGT